MTQEEDRGGWHEASDDKVTIRLLQAELARVKSENDGIRASHSVCVEDFGRSEAQVAALQQENNTLRLIASAIMPCHYCGVDEISKCPHGFPGCALADDALIGEMEELRALRGKVAALTKRLGELRATLKLVQMYAEDGLQRDMREEIADLARAELDKEIEG